MTGAGDAGVHFAQAGRRTALLLDRAALAGARRDHAAAALSSESRFLEPEAAAAAVQSAIQDCRAAGFQVAFKKMDSTLRGNPGAEIEAALAASGREAALVCPAMPKTGRTCRDGVLRLHGKPVRETEIGRDPFNPLKDSSVAGILAAQTNLPFGNLGLDAIHSGDEGLRNAVEKMAEAGKRLIIADAETTADLASLGRLLREAGTADGARRFPGLLPVGAGGLAEAFAGPARPGPKPEPRGRLLAVAGSLTGLSRSQGRLAADSGGFHPLELDMELALKDAEREISRLVAQLAKAGGRHLLLRNRAEPPPGVGPDAGVRAAGIFGAAAKALCLAGDCSILYATGGGTAAAVAAALGLGCLTLERECLPGVVLSSCSSPGTALGWFVSKAGGFGDPDVMVKLAAAIGRTA